MMRLLYNKIMQNPGRQELGIPAGRHGEMIAKPEDFLK